VRQRRLVDPFPEAYDGAEHDGVRMSFDDLLDQAVEGGDRVGENRGARGQRRPLRAVEAPIAVEAAAPAEALRQGLVPRREKVDGKGACPLEASEGGGRSREAATRKKAP